MSQHWDDIASAHIDGEASAADSARLMADPEGRAALEQLRRVSEANANVPPAPSGLGDLQLGAALDLFDELASDARISTPVSSDGGDAALEPSGKVIAFQQRRATRWVMGAAAALVVVAGAGLALTQTASNSDPTAEMADAGASAESELGNQAAASKIQSDESMAAAPMADDDTAGETAESAATAADDSGSDASSDAETFVTDQSTTTAAAAGAENPTPLVDITADDQLFDVVDRLTDAQQLLDDPETDTDQTLQLLLNRCSSAFEEFSAPAAASVRFDLQPATLIYSSTPIERVVVITEDCTILAADQRS